MGKQTLKRLEAYKKKHKLSDCAVADRLSRDRVKVYPVYLYRWRKAGRIIGAYECIIEDFLKKEERNGGM
jgi:hypothetical protein